jgi:protein CpxP
MPPSKNPHPKEAVMSKRRVFITTLFSLFLLAGIGACRQGHFSGGFDQFDLEAAAGRIATRLDLSDSQETELKGIITEIAAKAREIYADHESRHQELSNLIRQETISRDKVDRMMTEKFDRMKELADFAADRLVAFHAVLTSEQREKVAGQIEEHGATHRCFSQ